MAALTPRDPQNEKEWQEAVDGAFVLLLIDSSRQYGLIEGGPIADVARCSEILARGKRMSFEPSPLVLERLVMAQMSAEPELSPDEADAFKRAGPDGPHVEYEPIPLPEEPL